MPTTPAASTRFNQARGQIEKWWEKLKDDFDLHLIEFAEQAGRWGASANCGWQPTGKATSLSRALEAAADQAPSPSARRSIVLSDGLHNSAGSPVELAGKLGLSVHTVGVGASLRDNLCYRDIQVTAINCPDRLLLSNLARVTASVEAIGLAGRVVKAVLDEDGRQVARVRTDARRRGRAAESRLRVPPRRQGPAPLHGPRPARAGGEDRREQPADGRALVVEPAIRVLYLEGTLRPEYGALVDRFLAKDPDLEFSALVQTRPNVFLKRTNIQELKLTTIPTDQETIDKFDVFILGDLDSSYLRPRSRRAGQRVRDGAGLVMLGGYHSLGPGGYGHAAGQRCRWNWADARSGQIDEPSCPIDARGRAPPDLRQHRRLLSQRARPPRIAGLPPLDGCTRWGRGPAATVLATYRRPGHHAGAGLSTAPSGRIAVFSGDTTRNWQQGPRALDRIRPSCGSGGRWSAGWPGGPGDVGAGAGVTASTDKPATNPRSRSASGHRPRHRARGPATPG